MVAASGLLVACGGSDDPAPPPAPTLNVVELAQATPDLSTLVTAVTQAGLAGTLSGVGPFTVFAPTNAAFDALRLELGGGVTPITVAALLANPNLSAILTYHVVSGRVLRSQVPVGVPITTVQTETFTVNASLVITDQEARTANITATDILATNGVVHLIDRVILPNILP
jgi:uncharacterized surface protein with fasciclin (FAS1) repeats